MRGIILRKTSRKISTISNLIWIINHKVIISDSVTTVISDNDNNVNYSDVIISVCYATVDVNHNGMEIVDNDQAIYSAMYATAGVSHVNMVYQHDL